jgi:hypothetical protein
MEEHFDIAAQNVEAELRKDPMKNDIEKSYAIEFLEDQRGAIKANVFGCILTKYMRKR